MADIHYYALNRALEELYPEYAFSYEEHLEKYNGRPTKVKLEMLGLKDHEIAAVSLLKQKNTAQSIKDHLKPQDYIIQRNALNKLKGDGYILYVASNSIRYTVHCCLNAAGYNMVDAYFSNEDVGKPKPHPAIFLKSMLAAEVCPDETLIIEDSPVGLEAAYRSGAFVMRVNNPKDITYENIKREIDMINNPGSRGIA